MNTNDFEPVVRNMIAAYLKIPVAEVTPEHSLDELGMDSLGALELILTCEEEFGFTIALDKEEVEIITVDDAVKYVSRRATAESVVAL
jgi:acyl carrier protein